jgi:hypothetical protein
MKHAGGDGGTYLPRRNRLLLTFCVIVDDTVSGARIPLVAWPFLGSPISVSTVTGQIVANNGIHAFPGPWYVIVEIKHGSRTGYVLRAALTTNDDLL